ncbi:RNase P subunit [Scheffersomyces amazonensis]|uniref:RNase P subunit n=1 Tax=Scheffersomyces amazonensis TaxID=1078765 RepID=UPI00315C65D9
MVFMNLIRHSKYPTNYRDKIQFFQNSYLNHYTTSLVRYNFFYNRRWDNEGPHPSNPGESHFLSIDNGHYGLYYSMYNHDAERKQQQFEDERYILEYLLRESKRFQCTLWCENVSQLKKSTVIFIQQFNLDINHSFDTLKRFLYTSLSSNHSHIKFTKPYQSQYQFNQVRHFTTTTTKKDAVTEDAKIIELIDESSAPKPTKTFEQSLLDTQIAGITQIYSTYTQPEDLNMIYPLYQSLKRNQLTLPNIELYNIVLNSIIKRSLDSEFSLEAIENKLTTLLTIYQDILTSGLKPNHDTYNLILNTLLEGAIDCHNLTSNNQLHYAEIITKRQEFSKIAIDLYSSIMSLDKVDLSLIIPKLVNVLNINPDLLNTEVIETIAKQIKQLEILTFEDLKSFIKLSSNFTQFNVFEGDSSQLLIHDYIKNLYEIYCEYQNKDADEFIIYSLLVESLIHNKQLSLASQFLDDILIDYKKSLSLDNTPSKLQLSNLLSSYLKSIINVESDKLFKAHELIKQFNNISYLPDLSVHVYNTLISKYLCEIPINDINDKHYKIVYELYDFVAIRKDYQDTKTIQFMKEDGYICRELLLNKAIELGDHERIFQILKEILLKNHLIYDIMIFKNVLNYLFNGVLYNRPDDEPFNHYYYGLVWNLIENQAVHYESNPRDLADYLAEYLQYVIIPPYSGTVNGIEVDINRQQQITNYNIQLIMNSLFINKLIDEIDIQRDNMFGLITISKFLMSYNSGGDGIENDNENHNYSTTMTKIIEFQAKLINQFEDCDNHYLQLGEEVETFRDELINHFSTLMITHDQYKLELTTSMIEACKLLGISIEDKNKNKKGSLNKSNYNVNLSYLLNVNYKLGINKFIDLFFKGYNFSCMTWEIIINYNFINEYLDRNSHITRREFIKRIWTSNIDHDLKVELMSRLMALRSDKVNIKLIEMLMESEWLISMINGSPIDNKLLGNLFAACQSSENIQFKNLLIKPEFFKLIYSINQDLNWIDEYFSTLSKFERYDIIIELINQYNLNQLELSASTFPIYNSYLNALLKTGDMRQFSQVLELILSTNTNHLEVYRKEIIELLIEYNLIKCINDSYDGRLFLQMYIKYCDLSPTIRQGLSLLKLRDNLNNNKFDDIYSYKPAKSIKELSTRILAQDLGGMNKLYNDNSELLPDHGAKSELVRQLFDQLNKAKNLGIDNKVIRNKFNTMMKFLQMNKFRHLSFDNLLVAIKLLSNMGANDILNFLIKRFINHNNNQLSSLINFYFMEVDLVESSQQMKLLNWMNGSFYYLNDPVVIEAIGQFCKEKCIKLTEFNETKFQHQLT